MIYVLSFILLVAVIAIVTEKLNAKVYCEHDWHEHGHKVKCSKCNKVIPNYSQAKLRIEESYSEAA